MSSKDLEKKVNNFIQPNKYSEWFIIFYFILVDFNGQVEPHHAYKVKANTETKFPLLIRLDFLSDQRQQFT